MVSLSLIILITAEAVTPIKVGSNRLYVLSLALAIMLLTCFHSDSLELYNGYVTFDNFRLALLIIAYAIALVSINSQIGALVLLSLLGTTFLVTSNHLLTIIVALELQSFTGYALAYLSRNSNGSVSEDAAGAALKYLLLGALASAFIILGIALIYVTTGVLDYNTLQQLEWSGLSYIALVLLLAGFLFKLGVAPFHQWVPEVYGNVTNHTIAYISLTPKIGVLALLSVLVLSQEVVLGVSIFTIIVGSIGGLVQTEYRRLLAYSSITHIGYLLLAATVASHSVLLVYTLQYVVTTVAVLYCFRILDSNNTGQLSVVTTALNSQPYLAGILGILLFSLAGVPPFVGFFGKLEVFYSLIADRFYIVTVIAIITSIVGAYYYLRIMILMLNNTSDETYTITYTFGKYILVSSVALVVFAVLEGNLLLHVAQLMAQPFIQL